MNEAKINIDPESEESRTEGHDAFIKLMRRLGVDRMSPEERIGWLKETDVNVFLDLLSRSNGKLANVGKVQRWTGEATKSVVGFGGTTDSPDLEPPENAEEHFAVVYRQIQKDLTPENMKLWAGKLYAAIVFAHMFPNGNGRTARHSYALLTKPDLPDVKLSKNRGRAISELCLRLGIGAMQSLFKKHGVEWNDQRHYATTDGMSMGNMDFLKYLAAKEILGEDSASSGGSIELTTLTSEQKKLFDKRYSELRREWYSEVMSIVDQYPEYVTEELDAATDLEEKTSKEL